MDKQLDESNFILYAAKNYNNQCYDTMEFYDDLLRFKYLKRLFKRYAKTGELKERLILNHIIIIYNVFERDAATRLLFFKLKGYHNYLKPFLVFLNQMPETIEHIGIKNVTYYNSDITMDDKIIEVLRKIIPEWQM